MKLEVGIIGRERMGRFIDDQISRSARRHGEAETLELQGHGPNVRPFTTPVKIVIFQPPYPSDGTDVVLTNCAHEMIAGGFDGRAR